jgi:hypothetical protein
MEVVMRSVLMLAAVLGVVTPASAQVAGGGFFYARLGTGAVLAEPRRPATAFGFGYRGEIDTVGVDFSLLFMAADGQPPGDTVFAGAPIRLVVLRFLQPDAERSLFVGGGMSYAGTSFGGSRLADASYTTSWHGNGLQGEISAGYELARSSPIRMFVQTDVGLPLYMARRYRYSRTNGSTDYTSPSIDKRYAPSVAVTFGIGWRR